MKKSYKSGKYVFTLNNINVENIINRYGIETEQDLRDDSSLNTTKLCELNIEKGTQEIISFLDESKREHTCHISMIDFDSKMDVNLLRYHCFWCRHPFDTMPIGCPIRYVSSQVEKKYHSQISRDVYTIKENVTTRKRKEVDNDDEINVKIGEYYETDGVFCSFNCCKSWIDDNKKDKKYNMSNVLLSKMYNNIMDTKNVCISPAPHWRLLEQYGGHLNILKFREEFNKIDYKFHGNTQQSPKFVSVGFLYEENPKF